MEADDRARETVAALGRWTDGQGPLYRRLADAVRRAVERGDLPPGTRLPAERTLARAVAVSRSTAVAAYDLLRSEGWVDSRWGSGTYARLPRRRGISVLSDRPAAVRHEGLPLTADLGVPIDLSLACLAGLEGLPPGVLTLAPGDLDLSVPERGYAPLGLDALRESIAEEYSRSGLPTTTDHVLVTAGAQQAISLAAALFVGPGDAVAIESPTFVGAIDAFTRARARLVPVPVEADGLRVDALREALAGAAPRLLYLQPTHHNPTGAVMPEGRRADVAAMAERFEVPVVEDHTMAELPLDLGGDDEVPRDPPAPIARHARRGIVLTVGSMSKLYWAGLRVGWIRGPEPVITRLARLKVATDLGTSMLSQVVAYRLLPLAEEVRRIRRRQVTARARALEEGLRAELPEWSWPRPAGGLTLWVRLPRGDGGEFAQVAMRHGVAVLPGTAASPDHRHFDHVRVAFTPPPEVLGAAVGRLAAAWRAYEQGPGAGQGRPAVVV